MALRRVLRTAIAGVLLGGLTSSLHPTMYAVGPRDDMLTSVSWLVQHLNDPNLVLLQIGDAKTYAAGHIPGARAVELASFSMPMVMDAAGRHRTLPLELPPPDVLHDVLEGLGISDRSRIVIVESDNWFSPATRIYLTLAYAGLRTQTSLLDGGLTAWKAARQPTTTVVPEPRRGSLARLETVPVTVSAADVQAHATAPGFVLLDVRSPAAWDGTEPIQGPGGPKRGHIPGARSLPMEQLWDEKTSALKPAAEIERIFAAAGVKPSDTVFAYCYIGQRATAALFAAESLGHPVKLYDGSMVEWSELDLPLELPKKGGGW